MAEEKIILSRVGKAPIELAAKVSVTVKGDHVTVQGPLGKLERDFKGVTFEQQQGQILVHPVDSSRSGKALHGLGRNLLRNMVQGVTVGYKKQLDVIGVGFKVEQVGQALKFAIGFSHASNYVLPAGVECKVEKGTHIELIAIDKELLGQTAANIRGLRPPEPYKGKGIRYSDEKVRHKAGKSGGKGGKKK